MRDMTRCLCIISALVQMVMLERHALVDETRCVGKYGQKNDGCYLVAEHGAGGLTQRLVKSQGPKSAWCPGDASYRVCLPEGWWCRATARDI